MRTFIFILFFIYSGLTVVGQDVSEIIVNDTCKKIDVYLRSLAKERNFSGALLIIKNGEKIFSKGYGWADIKKSEPITPSTLLSMGSITKLFTATAVMKLVEMGKLSLNDELNNFFSNVPADKAHITIHQLLTHSSGFHEFLKEDGGDYEKIEAIPFLHRAFSEDLAFSPGSKAIYTNVGYSILGIIIEQVSGMTYESFLKKHLFDLNQIKNIGYHVDKTENANLAHGYINGKDWGTIPEHIKEKGDQPYWNLKANGGLEASLNDMYHWANAFTNHTILTNESIERMFSPLQKEEGFDSFFGYGCNVGKSRRGTKLIDNGGSNGIYFARLIRLPEEGVVFYLVTNESTTNANMVLPNVTQLYFSGTIEQDALLLKPGFHRADAKNLYEIVDQTEFTSLAKVLKERDIVIDNDMVLLEAGQRLMEENKLVKATLLYQYYTETFPQIVVAWNDLGDIYLRQGNKTEALNCYKMALKLRPENQRAKDNIMRLK
jgi:CubicO group peptidase (beta-lactamase class C family)